MLIPETEILFPVGLRPISSPLVSSEYGKPRRNPISMRKLVFEFDFKVGKGRAVHHQDASECLDPSHLNVWKERVMPDNSRVEDFVKEVKLARLIISS
ncbi:hypothetical protein AUG19_03605 [archaeon 13_1_20CM_2_54_9]|nr:MAG: hypothetical protein AUG19_03605 [archaeon 13_1_20CM_2_54_9]